MADTKATVAMLKAMMNAYNKHDLDSIMSFCAEDCVLDMPRGPHPYGQRFIGAAAVREALQSRFDGIPNVRYDDDNHFVTGDMGVSQWTLRGKTPGGEHIEVRGLDILTFRNGKITKKDAYWKIVER